MYQSRNIQRIAKEVTQLIEEDLQRVGLLYRIFYRCKHENSVKKKINTKNYNGENTFLRDSIGIRVNFYFVDDLDIIFKYLLKKLEGYYVEKTVDQISTTEFKPTRVNLVFRLNEHQTKEFRDVVNDKTIDNTFEIQLRTVLSEGWHEVDHDMRYKCNSDWEGHKDLSRYFNGILASLETSDYSILGLFDQLGYRHYQSGNWKGILRTKFRLRIQDDSNVDVGNMLKLDKELMKNIYKVDREDFVNRLLDLNYNFPITFTNVILVLNHFYWKRADLKKYEPDDFSLFIK